MENLETIGDYNIKYNEAINSDAKRKKKPNQSKIK